MLSMNAMLKIVTHTQNVRQVYLLSRRNVLEIVFMEARVLKFEIENDIAFLHLHSLYGVSESSAI